MNLIWIAKTSYQLEQLTMEKEQLNPHTQM